MSVLIAGASVALLLYLLCLYTYRIYFHSLSRFPGPKLAAATGWYEFYYDILKDGKFTHHIGALHRQYGPIVRIAPNELHILDPDFHSTLYAWDQQDRTAAFARRFGYSNDTFSSVGHDLHRNRRAALAPHFASARVNRFTGRMSDHVQAFLGRIDEFAGQDEPVPLNRAFTALTTDIITTYAFGKSFNHLQNPALETLEDSLKTIYETGQLAVHLPVFPILRIMPDWLAGWIRPELGVVLGMRAELALVIKDIRNQLHSPPPSPGAREKFGAPEKDQSNQSLFHALLQSALPAAEKSDNRLGDEAQLVIGAGLVTTAWTLTVASFYIASDEAVAARLRDECRNYNPAATTTDTAGALEGSARPFLTACILESLRLAGGVAARMPRVRNRPLRYSKWTIPAGAAVSMSSVLAFVDDKDYPSANQFLPDRWLRPENGRVDEEASQRLLSLVFGAGPRQCPGRKLALVELEIVLGTVFSKYQLEISPGVTAEDVKLHRSVFIGYPRADSKGVWGKFRRV